MKEKPYRELHLPGGHVALVDAEDWGRVTGLRWRVKQDPACSAKAYAQPYWQGRRASIYMHRFIVSPTKGYRVRPRNGNFLDCRKANILAIPRERAVMTFACSTCGITVRQETKLSARGHYCSIPCRQFALNTDLVLKSAWSHRTALRNRALRTYTPSMLRRFLSWVGPSCAFPNCPKAATGKNRWHLCEPHNRNCRSALRYARRRRSNGANQSTL